MTRRRETKLTTSSFEVAQPEIERAGLGSAARRPELSPPPPPAPLPPSRATFGATVPVTEVSQTSLLMTRARSCSDWCQSKRVAAS